MLANRKHILFTARDIGAAHQIKNIIEVFEKHEFKISILASNPAYDFFYDFHKSNLSKFEINGKPFISKNRSSQFIDKAVKEVVDTIKTLQPDIIFSGLSSSFYGVDEMALLASSNLKIPGFQFIDAWLSFNHMPNGYPDMYFVSDFATSMVSYKMAKAPMRVVGSPKHYAYACGKTKLSPHQYKKMLGLDENDKVISYFAPVPNSPGNFYNFCLLIDVLETLNKVYGKNIKFLLRFHPGFLNQYQSYYDYINSKDVTYIDVTMGYKVEYLLQVGDVLINSYSTVATDHAFLSYASPNPIGAVMFLLCGNEIQRYVKNKWKFWKNPLINQVETIDILNEDELLPMLVKLLENNDSIDKYFYSTKTGLYISDPSKKIIETVESLLY